MKKTALTLAIIVSVTTQMFGAIDFPEPVEFADPNLQSEVQQELGVQGLTSENMKSLTTLFMPYYRIHTVIGDLDGLQYATNLKQLHLFGSHCSEGGIKSLAPLTGLTHLEELELIKHRITDVQALSTLINLKKLDLSHNQITDISALQHLTLLEHVNLKDNPIPTAHLDEQIALIRQNNPSLAYMTDRFRPGQLVIPFVIMAILIMGIAVYTARTLQPATLPAMFCMCIVSGCIGAVLGGGAQILYVGLEEIDMFSANGRVNPRWLGVVLGGILGILAGAHFINHVGQCLRQIHNNKHPYLEVLVVGGITGFVCSTLLHILLMLSYHNTSLSPLLTGGFIFGLPAGFLLGLITVAYVAGFKSMQAPEFKDPEHA